MKKNVFGSELHNLLHSKITHIVVYLREHQFLQDLPCVDFLHRPAEGGNGVQGIWVRLVHYLKEKMFNLNIKSANIQVVISLRSWYLSLQS